ncbi:MAG: iron-sulfur cluster-binding protein [Chloroflexi bacterium]|nr:iron-sulfur cluster-binding protein [Chloroflexota bacterium]MDL1885818.1 iron-sulfur cluster-binding protein [Anaerolineae bacterium CFX8]
MNTTPNQFLEQAVIALDDIQLQTALERGTGNADSRRREAMAELADPNAIRLQGRAARLRGLDDLPDLLEQAERQIIARGGKVLWAADADEANRHVLNICREHNLRHGVKSKSMATEEIGLLPFLNQNGIEMIETDLGEYIVQLSGSHPSHIIMPVMHMTKEQIRDLFMDKLAMPYTDDPADMTAWARKTLREEYLRADFGMSGGNFIIAETGSVVIVTNEGNGRLCTTVPPVHIAVVGIEKVIPTWEDFATLLQLLCRSGTGQRMSVYANTFNGPAQPGEPDGPEHFYLILLDNGRSDIYASEYTEALACIRCGACLNICPVYRSVGGHAYGSTYPGPIGSVITPLLKGKANAAPLPFASSLCGACQEACPVGINLPGMLLKLRRDLQAEQDPLWQMGMKAFGFGMSHPLLYNVGGRLASEALQSLGEDAGSDMVNSLPYPLSGWTDHRDFPVFPEERFRDWWRKNRT